MNALETFLASLPGGFLTDETLPKLQQLDRLFPVLVRCHSYRFTTPVQNAAALIALVGQELRDVSIPAGMTERARTWAPDAPVTRVGDLPASFLAPKGWSYVEA